MLGFNHTLMGGIIAVTVHPALAPIVAFGSHFVLDAFPHFGRHPKFKGLNSNMKKLIAVDGLLCAIIAFILLLLWPEKWLVLIACLFMSNLPDFSWIFRRQLHTPKWLIDFMSWIQWGERPWGWLLDIAYGVIMSIFLYTLAY